MGSAETSRTSLATNAVVKEHPDVWYDSSKLKQVMSLIVFNGTQQILEGDFERAHPQLLAAKDCFFENFIAVLLDKKASFDMTQMYEQCFREECLPRKRILCSCLDEKYKEVKSITKTGILCLQLKLYHFALE